MASNHVAFFGSEFGLERVEAKKLRESSIWFIVIGAIMLALGLYACFHFVAATIASVMVLGSIFIIGGIFEGLNAFKARSWNIALLDVLMATLYLVAGFFILLHPANAALTLTLLISAVFMVNGIMRIIGALAIKPSHWGWVLFHGVISVGLSIMLFQQWPISGLWAIGLFVGIDLIVSGSTLIGAGLTIRRHTKEFDPHGPTVTGSAA